MGSVPSVPVFPDIPLSIDDQVNLGVDENVSCRVDYCYLHLIIGESAGV